MHKAVERFMEGRYSAVSSVFVILFISVGRFLEETARQTDLNMSVSFRALITTLAFYTVLYFLYVMLLKLLLARPFEKVANAVCIGLFFGLIPPLIDIFSGRKIITYYYFEKWSPLLIDLDRQPLGETIVLWMLILATPLFVYYITGSFWRALAGAVSSYLFIQFVGSASVITIKKIYGGDYRLVNDALNIIVSFGIYVVLRGRPLMASIMRFNHALPFVMLGLCGSAIVGHSWAESTWRVLMIFFWCLIMIIHNDYFDREEDRIAQRSYATSLDDVIWSGFFFILMLSLIAHYAVYFAIVLFLGLIAGFFYHHPDMRLKKRFCLSYKVEGTWALVAFLAGATSAGGMAGDVSLVVPSVVVFFGGVLVSIPKDWKDIDSDRQARIPTYYVVLTRSGTPDKVIHLRLVGLVTAGLMIPPLLATWTDKAPDGLNALLWVCGFLPGAALLLISNRKHSVEVMLWLLSMYLLVLSFMIRLNGFAIQ